MSRITKLEPQQGAARRISVFVDDRFVAGLSARAVRDLGLQVGHEFSADLHREILRASARDSALLSLARREHSRAELTGKLHQKGFAGELIALVLDELERQRYLDDRRFARMWVEHRRASHPRGRRMMALELEHKGVSTEIAREALNVAFPEDEECGDLAELIRKRLRNARRTEPQVFKRRLLGFLARRGFSYADIRQVLAEQFPQLGHPAPDEGGLPDDE